MGKGNPYHDPKNGKFISGPNGPMGREDAMAHGDAIEAHVKAASDKLSVFPSNGPFGMVPENIRTSPEYRRVKAEFDAAFQRQRNFNQVFVKAFGSRSKRMR